MAARYFAGRAIVFTASGTVAYTGVATVATTQNEVQSVSLDDQFTTIETLNRQGQVVGQMAITQRQSLTVEIVPHGNTASEPFANASTAQAAATAAVELPTPLALVTLASFEVDEFNGTWNYQGGGRIGLSNTGAITVTLPLGRPDGAALTPLAHT